MPEIAASPIEPLPKPPFGHKADQMKQAAPNKGLYTAATDTFQRQWHTQHQKYGL